MAEQLKVIVLTTFISVFLTFTYVKFIQKPVYVSFAKVLLPENASGNLGSLAGLASQFGVTIPSGAKKTDLSSPSLYPELLRSRTFAEKILDKKFYLNEYQKEMSLLSILTHGDSPTKIGRDTLIGKAVGELNTKVLGYTKNMKSDVSVIQVTTSEPLFAKELLTLVLKELEDLNRSYRSQTIREKIAFIENRISSVEDDLKNSEKRLKDFNEKNRQISSPALELDQERLYRDVDIQKGIYLTLKEQLELGKIEEIQEASIVQILDYPQIPLGPANINLVSNVLLSALLGLGLGIAIGFIRVYLKNSDINERKKIKKMKLSAKKKINDLLLDRRISGLISLTLLIGLPYYLSYKSQNPVFFGMYSSKLMIVNTIYIIILLFSSGLFLSLSRKRKKIK